MRASPLGWDHAALAAAAAVIAVVLLASALGPDHQPPTLGRCRHTIDVNTASADELSLLPGIGPVLARRIVRHRARHGPFESLESLGAVRGVSAPCVAGLRNLVRTRRPGGKDPCP